MNLYRQQHAILGGWAAVNPVFVNDATPDVMAELVKLPTGARLIQHIENLRSGATPMHSVARDLQPYGGLMAEAVASTDLSESELAELRQALDLFIPDSNGLQKIKSLNVVKKFGDEWQVGIRSSIKGYPELLEPWENVIKTDRAFYLWKIANDIISQPLNERARAQVQADLPEYETYLPLFGDSGKELLTKLRTFMSVV
jgi:hypothetical protein